MSEYTKGPWEILPYGDDLRIGAANGAVDIADVCVDVPEEEEHANARLIAAAPELLEALMALRSFMWAEGYADQNLPMAQADAAIAKAEGK